MFQSLIRSLITGSIAVVIVFRTKIPEDELNEIIASIHSQFNTNTMAASALVSSTDDHKSTSASVSTTSTEDRKMRNLRKKLEQIRALKEKQERGEILEANQVRSRIFSAFV